MEREKREMSDRERETGRQRDRGEEEVKRVRSVENSRIAGESHTLWRLPPHTSHTKTFFFKGKREREKRERKEREREERERERSQLESNKQTNKQTPQREREGEWAAAGGRRVDDGAPLDSFDSFLFAEWLSRRRSESRKYLLANPMRRKMKGDGDREREEEEERRRPSSDDVIIRLG
jgi:hypothetical protein